MKNILYEMCSSEDLNAINFYVMEHALFCYLTVKLTIICTNIISNFFCLLKKKKRSMF